jgi:hypothetical protein
MQNAYKIIASKTGEKNFWKDISTFWYFVNITQQKSLPHTYTATQLLQRLRCFNTWK